MSVPKKVLLVDDDVDFVDMNRAVLEQNGYEVEVAYNGKECLDRVREGKPDLIILDLMMATWSEGLEVADELRGTAETKDIPIILVSAVSLKDASAFDRGSQKALPADAYIEKPVGPNQLLERVREFLAPVATPPEAGEAEDTTAPVVMLVDDDADFIEATRAVLETAGYQVLSVSGASEARERMDKNKVDIVITDLMMETLLSGFMFTQQLKQNPRFRRIPIVVVTAMGFEHGFMLAPDQKALTVAGIDGYFEKPVKPSVLLAKVDGLLKGRGREKTA